MGPRGHLHVGLPGFAEVRPGGRGLHPARCEGAVAAEATPDAELLESSPNPGAEVLRRPSGLPSEPGRGQVRQRPDTSRCDPSLIDTRVFTSRPSRGEDWETTGRPPVPSTPVHVHSTRSTCVGSRRGLPVHAPTARTGHGGHGPPSGARVTPPLGPRQTADGCRHGYLDDLHLEGRSRTRSQENESLGWAHRCLDNPAGTAEVTPPPSAQARSPGSTACMHCRPMPKRRALAPCCMAAAARAPTHGSWTWGSCLTRSPDGQRGSLLCTLADWPPGSLLSARQGSQLARLRTDLQPPSRLASTQARLAGSNASQEVRKGCRAINRCISQQTNPTLIPAKQSAWQAARLLANKEPTSPD